MSGLKNSTFGSDPDDDRPPTNRQRTDDDLQEPRDYGDRFIPTRARAICALHTTSKDDAGPLPPQKSTLSKEVTPPEHNRPTSPTRPRRRLPRQVHPVHTHPSPPLCLPLALHLRSLHPTRRLDTTTDSAYSMKPRRQLRNVCKTPYRVLDAPELAEDFYLNLVDWSSTNVLGVGLGSCVYLWTAHNAAVNRLCDLSDSNDSISSVSWVQKARSTLAVGTISGRLHVYDANRLTLQRTYQQAHSQRIGAIAWNATFSPPATSRPFKRCSGHRQERGNDNKVCIWDLRGSRRSNNAGGAARSVGGTPGASGSGGGSGSGTEDAGGDAPLWKFHEHTAAVKALAGTPCGGTQDKHIRFWNTISGVHLIWSLTSHELVSTHGFVHHGQNQICIWKYPTLTCPDGETIVTGAGDEHCGFWNAFPKREVGERGAESRLDYGG
ncbi:WD40-repeat-containing domain protein [Mycena leptocephala]|nr:WD40-repeat-containing domain protein [Mycena leptocephala]